MHLDDLFAESPTTDIEWVVPKSCRHAVESGQESVVWVDVAKFEASFSKDRNFYVGPKGSANGIKGRYPRFDQWVRGMQPVEMSEAGFDWRKNATFINGRHRFAWMRDHGATAVPMVVPTEEAPEFASQFGTHQRKTIVRL